MAIGNFVRLNDGSTMPIIAFGTWQLKDTHVLENVLEAALQAGYRHFDTGFINENEELLGSVFKKWFNTGRVKREDLYIVSKLPMTGIWPYRVNEFLRKSLAALQIDYVDLYMIQFPVGLKYDESEIIPKDEDGNVKLDVKTHLEATWRAMEHEVKAGRTKSIGLSNFNQEQIERILQSCRIPPAILQVEVNAYFQQTIIRQFCEKHNIKVCAFSPLGVETPEITPEKNCGSASALMQDPAIVEIAQRYRKTEAQILIRFLAQSGIVVISRSFNPQRVKINIDIFDFELSETDFNLIKKLDKGKLGRSKRSFFKRLLSGAEEHPEYPWND